MINFIGDDLDETNSKIRDERQKLLDEREGVRVGDFVRFVDGVVRRASHVWRRDDRSAEDVQTSEVSQGSYYLGKGGCSFSGSLFNSVPATSLTRTEETKMGSVWFFRNGWVEAHNGLGTRISFRVFDCSLPAPK